jgi:hypothetical protein
MPSSSSIPSRTIRTTIAKRRMGLYKTEETLAEAEYVSKQRQPGDVGFTLIHRAGVFSAYNLKEFLSQLKVWRDSGCVLIASNVIPIRINDKDAWLFTIQPPNLSADNSRICPLAMAFSLLVSGFSYVVYEKHTADLVVRALTA